MDNGTLDEKIENDDITTADLPQLSNSQLARLLELTIKQLEGAVKELREKLNIRGIALLAVRGFDEGLIAEVKRRLGVE